MSLDNKEENAVVAVAEPDVPAPPAMTAVWILDDSPMEAAMARRALAPHYDVRTFVDGTTLLEAIATEAPPNVLLLDWQLPRMSGIEVCRFLRTTRDEMELPILMLTVYGHKTDLVDGLGAGANDYLTKPYDAPELAARVATLARLNSLHHKVRRAERVAADLLAREREARAESDTANRAKDEFLALVSHELRTPLNAILGWTGLLRAGDLTADQTQKALATVERNALAQTRLIDDLMDTSRILSGKLTIDRQPIELVSLVQTSVEAIRPSAIAKNITLQASIDPEASQILGDGGRIQQMIWNLLANAIKFTQKGGRVRILVEAAGPEVRISVVDTGPGITPDFLPHVFERFRQAEAGASSGRGGLGLGLAIVKHIAELHGGAVEARSPGAGLGASFIVSLPKTGSVPPHAADEEAASIAGRHAARPIDGVHVLIVDDNEDALFLLARLLGKSGAAVRSVTSVALALEAIDKHVPDVLISDLAMPERDGFELVRAVRALPEERRSRIPALALTAFASPEDRERSLVAGFDAYATKPPVPDQLVGLVARLAASRRR